MAFRDGLHAAHHLPLRDRVDGIDVKEPRLAVLIPLMHGVQAQIAGLAAWIGLAPLGYGNLARLGVVDRDPVAAVEQAVPQVVEVGNGNTGQSDVLGPAETRWPCTWGISARPRASCCWWYSA